MSMNWADYSILAIIALSLLISLVRGFTKEALSLAGWLVAFWVALTFANNLEPLLQPYIEVPSVRLSVAFAVLFLVTLLLATLVNFMAVQLVRKTGLSGTDRFIGAFFGIARGVVVVLALVILAGLTALPEDPWWSASLLIPYFQETAIWVRYYLPDELANSIHY
ncbi:CvpA family protein [Thiohalomonas denitrificans]|uniref:Membrane protein required for colicin V production n=1 Tax=Thiohalomonas denitrificans TaxID=415747 RepID=A0A1G5QPC9_9GAMM|nr:CvpA family protein [Thiohalomonas denitrificans]SCZ63734.1 membrane protein required for colicin V production [Thiohalomonas denitrificans]